MDRSGSCPESTPKWLNKRILFKKRGQFRSPRLIQLFRQDSQKSQIENGSTNRSVHEEWLKASLCPQLKANFLSGKSSELLLETNSVFLDRLKVPKWLAISLYLWKVERKWSISAYHLSINSIRLDNASLKVWTKWSKTTNAILYFPKLTRDFSLPGKTSHHCFVGGD